ncbi:rRNA pseudouridine synthase [Actinocorallia sp. API 0066]|uniref:pseudouridine synthase n=1 Tax=Actinocorallia sp. API 0066 TaxID=2896846 RepID=UPI001E64F653|nr:pseudouridine synthase [Actinocorallia sp. API 0066]MCD0450719.1 rRNA pseudouridine synthase [Actinocorallia sp. API 0066]
MNTTGDATDGEGVRLQKVLADAGIGSRRACERLISDGRVKVNGKTVSWFGERVHPRTDEIQVDGRKIETWHEFRYYALNKPLDVESTMAPGRGTRTLIDFVEDLTERIYHVGRLDTDTEGLILLTNDGELAHRLTHPSFGVTKTYLADVPGPIARDLGRRLRSGIVLDDGPVKVDGFSLVEQSGRRALVEVVLHEGRKHIVRRLLKEVGHPVRRLARTGFGPVQLGRLKPGGVRALTEKEVAALYKAVGL